MKWTECYIPTLREDPAEAEIVSHKLLVRAGYIRKLAAGVYNYLPLMQRVLTKISNIVREEMNSAGAQEILMPVLHPAELWQQSGRWQTIGKELMRTKDRHDRDLVLGGTHEEVVTNLIKGEIRSYRQLPLNLYQIQNKFRDEIRPRFGLMRGREFIMKDAYSFDRDEERFKLSYQKMIDAYSKAFTRCGLETKIVESDTGAMGGKAAHEFMVIVNTEGGENIIFYCDKCDYAANQDKASSISDTEIETETETKKGDTQKPLQKVATPNAKTVEEVTAFLNVPAKKLVKTLLYKADGEVVAAMIRGDRQINEIKLKNFLKCIDLEMADAPTVEKITGAKVGFAGPVGLKNVKIIVDEEIPRMRNFITGANQDDYHFINVNVGRDVKIDSVSEIRNAQTGERCPRCKKGVLITAKGIEVGNTFMLGTKYSESLGATFIDEDGKEKPFIMGSYGIGITRTAQAAVEKFHDEAGIIWPASIAPLAVEILPLNINDEKQKEVAFQLYQKLNEKNIEVLIDDRDERAGVKFNDADLIGLPLRVNVGDKSLKKGEVEIVVRKTKEVISVKPEEVMEKCLELLSSL
jgi:prolyl-tRNA synthetase